MTRTITITFLAAAAFAVGCKPAKSESTAAKRVQAAEAKATTETKEAEQAIADYAYARRAEFVARLQTESSELNRELDQLGAKIESASAAVKAEAQPKLQALRQKVAQLNTQLDEAKSASEPAWEGIKSATKKSFEELKDGFQQSRLWLSEKIAP